MVLKADDLLQDPAFPAVLKALSGGLVAVFRQNPRLTLIFASHQRWMMAQCGFALSCERNPDDPASGLYAARFIETLLEHDVASRNTAASFLKEMQAYRFIEPVADAPDRRVRPLEPSPVSVEGMMTWLKAHARALDSLRGGNRLKLLEKHPELLRLAQPNIAHGIVTSAVVRNPGETYKIFSWANSGSLIMDWFMCNLALDREEDGRIPVPNVSLSEVSAHFRISKTHLKRIFLQAEKIGGIGFTTRFKKPELWISRTFFGECLRYQSEKLSIVAGALDLACGEAGIDPELAIEPEAFAAAAGADPDRLARPRYTIARPVIT